MLRARARDKIIYPESINLIDMKGYKKGYCWKTPAKAEKHQKDLRKTKYGIRKKKVYSGVKIKKQGRKHCTFAKESKGYINWLRTGR